MNKVRLKFKGLSEIAGNEKIGIIVLTDMVEKREITVVCDKNMIYQLELRLRKLDGVSKLLPEVLCNVIKNQTDVLMEVIIHDVVNGQYVSTLYNQKTLDAVPIRISDAVLLTLLSDVPLYIEENLMLKQSVSYELPANNLALPLNTLDTDMLKEALDKAVNDEKYEMASLLRDELRRRNMNAAKTDNDNERS
ncbi:bifunctional nuclease domain-containing protein [Xylanibacter oryzae]|jgi:uncharacterized protein|uniref:bifunctional nuclease domain-containing protein n=1 Tax=Xylanibacter oryzae TaxID=185293 RepID=UPI0004AF204B|nr:bifunctional nuclease domain-containing protein [Xylanibacter oryzae]